jgi:hypothetical protein
MRDERRQPLDAHLVAIAIAANAVAFAFTFSPWWWLWLRGDLGAFELSSEPMLLALRSIVWLGTVTYSVMLFSGSPRGCAITAVLALPWFLQLLALLLGLLRLLVRNSGGWMNPG